MSSTFTIGDKGGALREGADVRTEYQVSRKQFTQMRDQAWSDREADRPEPFFAEPPAWMTEPGYMPCVPPPYWDKAQQVAHMNQWDVTTGSGPSGRQKAEKRAAELCEGCPVLAQCRMAALGEEVSLDEKGSPTGTPLSAQGRFLVRGGWLPVQRAEWALTEAGLVCENGHPNPNGLKQCRKCREDRKSASTAIVRSELTKCDDCGRTLRVGSLPRHRKRVHGTNPEPILRGRLDESVVEVLLAGEHARASREEKAEALRRWVAMGHSKASLCRTHGWREGRYDNEGEAA